MASNFLHYEIKRKLGEGGMGIVYLARDTRLKRDVALKFLPKRIAKDQSKHGRFRVEAQAAAVLNHPNIAQVYAIEEANGELCIVLEYVEGQELKDIIEESNFGNDKKVEIAEEIAEGIKAAHDKGIIHRDIKSRNIMIDVSNRVKIMDFGLARLEGSESTISKDTTAGTTAYMSPEQLHGKEADNRSDIWSYGVVLYELFTGKLPFQGMHEAAIMYSITEEEPLPISSDSTEIPEYICQIINRCLEKRAEDRYQEISEVLDDLRNERKAINDSVSSETTYSSNRNTYLVMGTLVLTILLTLFIFYQNSEFNLMGNVPQKKYLAVLPIENFGNNPELQAIGDGLAETFSYRLSELEQYQGSYWVTPASEIRKENVASAPQANKMFGVTLAIASSIQTIQDSTKMILQLIDAENVRTIGAEQVVVHSSNLAQLETEGIKAMLRMLRIDLQPDMEETLRAGTPSDPKAYEYYLKGRASLQKEDNLEVLNTAIGHFEMALQLDPEFALAHAGLGESYWRQYLITRDVSLAEEASASLDRAQTINSELPAVQYLLGLIEDGTGNHQKAVNHYQNALELDSRFSQASKGMAMAYENLGEFEKADSIYKRAIAQKPEYWRGYSDIGEYYLFREEWNLAIQNLRKAINLAPQNSSAYSNLGYAYYFSNELDSAQVMFEQSLAIDDNPITANNLVGVYFRNGKYSEAAEMYKKLLEDESYSDRYEFWGNYAAAVKWSEDLDGEKDLYRIAIEKAGTQLEVNPNDPVVLSYIAAFHSDLDNPEQAIEYIEKALSLNQEDHEVLINAISTYENLGLREEALRWVRADLLSQIEWLPDLQSLIESPEYIEVKEKLSNQES